MNGFRKYMKDIGGNLGWCKPLSFLDGKVVLAINEDGVCGIRMDGEDVKMDGAKGFSWGFSDATLERVARLVNEYYDYYKGWGNLHIILEATHDELECCDCPWFDVCDAMDNPDDWEHEDYQDDEE